MLSHRKIQLNRYCKIALLTIFSIWSLALHSAMMSDISVSLSSVYDGKNPIVLDTSWFEDVGDSSLRIQIEGASGIKTYLYSISGKKDVVWYPAENGDYTLTIQKQVDDSWVDTTYVKHLTVNGITTATADDIALDLSLSNEQAELALSIKEDGVRESANLELLTYSSLWDGDSDSSVTIAQDGVSLSADLQGEGTLPWSVSRNGTYELTHTTYTNGVAGKVEKATFIVSGLAELFPEGAIVATGYMGKYDGAAHGITVSVPEGATVSYALEETGPFGDAPTFTDSCSETKVWFEVTKAGYIPYTNSVTVVIEKREVKLVSDSASKNYDGTALTKESINIIGDGFVEGEGVVCTYTGTQIAVGSSANSFDYVFNEDTNADNYLITKEEGSLEVVATSIIDGSGNEEPGEGEVPVGGVSKYDVSAQYDGEEHAIDTNKLMIACTERIIGSSETRLWFVKAQDEESAAPIEGWTDMLPSYVDAGEYTIWYKVTNPNYVDFVHKVKISISRCPVVVKSQNITKPYDGAPLKLTASDITVDNLVEGESFVYSDLAERTEAGQTPATFTVSAGENTKLANYEVKTEFGTITITKSATEISVTANSETWVYDGAAHVNHTYAATNLDTLQSTDELVVTFDESSVVTTPQDGTEGDGTVANTILSVRVIRNGTEDVTANYTIGIYPGTLSVTKRPVTVKVVGKSESVTYDGKEHLLKGYDIMKEDALYNLTDTSFGGTTETHGKDANTYSMGLKSADFTNNNACFDVTYEVMDGNLSITPADIASNEGADCKVVLGAGLVYNGAAQEQTITSVTYKGLAVDYSLSGNLQKDAENYNLKIMGKGNFTGELVIPWTLSPRPVVVKSQNITKPYDGTPLKLTASDITADNLVEGESFVYSDLAERTEAGQTSATFTVSAGENTNLDNYNITTQFGTITVTKSATEISVTADSETWVYDGAAHVNHEYTTTNLEILQSTDKLVVTFDENSRVTTPQEGTVANTILSARVVRNGTEDVTANYTIGKYPGTLSVTKRPVTVKVVGKSESVIYDGKEHSVKSYDIATEDTIYNLADTSFGGTAETRGTDGNTYFMGLKPDDFTNNNACFDVTYEVTDGKLSITPADIASNDGADCKVVLGESPIYNGAAQVQTITSVTYKDLAVDYSLTENIQNDAGNYNLKITGKGNFTGELAIPWTLLPRSVVVKSSDMTKPYDGTPLKLTAEDITVDNLVEGESFVYSDLAERTEAGQTPAAFSVSAGENTKLDNYEVKTEFGTITITKSATEISVTANSETWVYDGAAHVNHEYTTTNLDTLQSTDELVVTFDKNSRVTTPQEGAVANTILSARVVRNATEDVTANYTIGKYPGTLSVTKRPVTVKVVGKSESVTYDGKEHSVKGYDITKEDALYNLADTSFGGTAETHGTDANTYAMGLKPADFANNNACFDVTYEVADGKLSIVPANISSNEGADCKVVLGESPIYNGAAQEQSIASVSYKDLAVDYSLTENTQKDANTYNLKITGKGNFTGELLIPWTLSPRPVVVKSQNITKPYDGTPLKLTANDITADNLVEGESFVYSDLAERTEAGQTFATFTVLAGENTNLDNYEIKTEFGTITITKSATEISVTANSATWVYDGAAHVNHEYTTTNLEILQSTDELIVTFDENSRVTTPQEGTVANTITSVRVMRNGTEDVTANYTIGKYPGTLSVTKRPVTVKVVGKSESVTYDGKEHSVKDYNIATEDTIYQLADTTFSGTAEARGTDANTYSMGLKPADFANNNACFDVTYEVTDGKLSITPTDISSNEGTDCRVVLGGSPIYNGAAQEQTITSVTYKGLAVDYSLSDNLQKDAGNYNFKIMGKGNFTGELLIPWTLSPRPVVVKSQNITKPYDGTPLKLTASDITADNLIEGESFVYSDLAERTEAGQTSATFEVSAGEDTKLDNYEIKPEFGTITITPAAVDPSAVIGDGEMDAEGNPLCVRTYNGAPQPFELAPNFDEPFRILYALEPNDESAYAETPPTQTNVAEGDLTVYFKFMSSNYATYYGHGTLRIVPKTLTKEMVGVEALEDYYYDGTPKCPKPYAKDPGALITPNDYEVTYEDNVNPGKAKVVFNGKNNYSGRVVIEFNILNKEAIKVVFDALGGFIGEENCVTQELESIYGALPKTTRNGYAFAGWYLGVTNGAPKAVEGERLLAEGGHTLYARWLAESAIDAEGRSIFNWEAQGQTARILGFRDPSLQISNLVIPDSIEGYLVTEIAADAFAYSSNGIASVTLPAFCKTVGRRAFAVIKTLTTLTITPVRDWESPSKVGTLEIGEYAFAGTGLEAVYLPAAVSSLGDYAFMNCQKLEEVTILGAPIVGARPFRRAGISAAKRPCIHLDPALADNAAYLAELKEEFGLGKDVAEVNTDAVIAGLSLGGFALTDSRTVRLAVGVKRASTWGEVNASRLRVAYQPQLSDAPIDLVPRTVTQEEDCTLVVEVDAPEGASGFFRVKMVK